MFLAIVLALAVTSSAAPSREQHTEHLISARAQPELHFQRWVEQHAKPYAEDTTEYARRLTTWLENLEYVLAYNSKHSSHWLGLNSLADLTTDEYRQHYLGFDNAARQARPTKLGGTFKYADVDADSLPVSIDWRQKGAVSEVKNQAQCGELRLGLFNLGLGLPNQPCK